MLDDATHQRITTLTDAGNESADGGDLQGALAKFLEALKLIPEPLDDYEANTWLLASIGDLYFQLGEYPAARTALHGAVRSYGGLGNPFIHLRLGQAELELGNEARAAEELARAYVAEGAELFEEEDAKYLRFIQSRLPPQTA
jgi:tetratricopeptide (TPR) repeat protein